MTETKNIPPRRIPFLITQVMRFLFHLLYHSFSWAYDLVAALVSLGQWKTWVLGTAQFITGQRILELGFGPGHLQQHLAETGKTVFGIDESRQMVRKAAQHLAQRRQPVHLVRGLAQALPFQDEVFDQVVATFPAPYIIDPATLADVQRVLRPGGALVVLFATWITGNSAFERLLALIFRVTGETPDDIQWLGEPYQAAGFDTRFELIELQRSRLLYIIAAKQPQTASTKANIGRRT
jgi:SAM-dependent methyltransferase